MSGFRLSSVRRRATWYSFHLPTTLVSQGSFSVNRLVSNFVCGTLISTNILSTRTTWPAENLVKRRLWTTSLKSEPVLLAWPLETSANRFNFSLNFLCCSATRKNSDLSSSAGVGSAMLIRFLPVLGGESVSGVVTKDKSWEWGRYTVGESAYGSTLFRPVSFGVIDNDSENICGVVSEARLVEEAEEVDVSCCGASSSWSTVSGSNFPCPKNNGDLSWRNLEVPAATLLCITPTTPRKLCWTDCLDRCVARAKMFLLFSSAQIFGIWPKKTVRASWESSCGLQYVSR